MTVSIRSACISDVDSIVRLSAQLGYDVESSQVEARLTRILARSDQRVLVADVEAKAVGWLHAVVFEEIETDPFVVVAGLVVDRSCRKQGIGRQLMAEAERWAQEQRCSVVRLWSSARRTASHRFYEQLGYTNIKTQYSFLKSLGGNDDFSSFVPRIDGEPAGTDVSES